MKRNALGVMLMAVVAVLLFGASQASAKTKEQVSLTFLVANQVRVGWDIMIANFERVYPNIDVKPEYVDGQVFTPTILSRLQTGTIPDIFLPAGPGASSPAAVYALGFQGKLLDLTPKNLWWKRVPKPFRKYFTVKQRIYSAPIAYAPQGMMYNSDQFRTLGLKPPSTFSDLLGLCQKIRAAGKIPIAAGFAGLSASALFTNIAITSFVYSKDPDWTLKRIQGKVTFAGSPLWRRALQTIVDLRDANCFQPAPAGTTLAQQYALISSGQALMMPSAILEIPAIAAINPSLNMKLFAYPGDTAADTQAEVNTSLTTISISSTTGHPKEARMFVDFVSRPKQSAVFAKAIGSISGPEITAGTVPQTLSDMAPLFKSGKAQFLAVSGWPRPDLGLYVPGLLTQIPGLFTGQRTVDQILQREDEAWAPVGKK